MSTLSDGLLSGAELILIERATHQDRGFSRVHDAFEHEDGALCRVAAHLANPQDTDFVPEWGRLLARKHLESPVRRLQIAGALLAAEIDRIQSDRRMLSAAATASFEALREALAYRGATVIAADDGASSHEV